MRDILHCDLNNFFASVECLKRPELKKVPMAVCGDPNSRHGIILAKNDIAKKFGIVTAETVYSARNKCPNLVLVSSSYSDYKKYSKIVNEIYLKYTDRVEPFGIDESFLDITESKKLFGSPENIAFKIKEEVKEKTGLTISVGVSFTKALAKLGSDMKKPDAITVLDSENYKKKIYNLPVNMLLFVGKSAEKSLKQVGIYTIGDLANSNVEKVKKILGKLGETIHNYANGLDFEQVKKYTDERIPKSISKGRTFSLDTHDMNFLEKEIRNLTNYVVNELRSYNMLARSVSVIIKSKDFKVINRQTKIIETNNYQDILKGILKLFEANYIGNYDIRMVTVGVSDLIKENDVTQISMFDKTNDKKNNINKVIDNINKKCGKEIVGFSYISNQNKI